MRRIVFQSINLALCVFLCSCQSSAIEQTTPESVPPKQQQFGQSTRSVDTVISKAHGDSNAFLKTNPSAKQVDTKKTSAGLPSASKEPRRFYTMPPRTVDSLIATFGAVNRLHPEDRALFDRAYSTGKELNPVLDPKTGKTLPFPYAFPSRYAADIRRLDSIKAADSIRRKR